MTRRILFFCLLGTTFAAACGDAAEISPAPATDAGADATDDRTEPGDAADDATDASVEADAPDGDAGDPVKLLAAGEVGLLGVTSDDLAIFVRQSAQTRSLEAVPLAGGATTTILADVAESTRIAIEGGAVGIWRNVDAATSIGAFGFWTKAGGLHLDVAPASYATYFRASHDGSRLAFFSNAGAVPNGTLTTADLSVARASSATTTAVFTGTDRVSFEDASCLPRIGFAGDRLIATYCAPGATTARLSMVSDFTTAVARVLVTDGLDSDWSADQTGSNVFVVARSDKQGSVVTDTAIVPGARVPIESGIDQGFMLRDGSAVVYRKGTTLKRALVTNLASPITMATGDASGILEVSSGAGVVLYHALPGIPLDPKDPTGDRFVDLRTVPTNATNAAPTVLVSDARTYALGLTADGSHALFLSKGFKLGRVKIASAVESTMPPTFQTVSTTPSGAAVVLCVDTRQVGTKTVCDLDYVDFAGNAEPVRIAESVPSGVSFYFGVAAPKKLAYVVIASANAGLYVRDLP